MRARDPPGFAFEEHEGGGWSKLLSGRTAHLLTTMDTPSWVYRWIYKSPGLTSLALASLGFCGIAPVRRSIFGPVKDSDPEQRARWLEAARRHGARLREGVLVVFVVSGLYMVRLPDAGFDTKKISALAALRLAWRLANVLPRLVEQLPDSLVSFIP